MRHPICCRTRSSTARLPLLLDFAGSVLPSACSGYYPLGEASGNDLVDGDGSITQVRAAGAALDVRLPAPDAGRRCLASGTSITFESDARLCDQCAALYHRQHVPAECKSCGRKLTGEPVRAAASP